MVLLALPQMTLPCVKGRDAWLSVLASIPSALLRRSSSSSRLLRALSLHPIRPLWGQAASARSVSASVGARDRPSRQRGVAAADTAQAEFCSSLTPHPHDTRRTVER